MQTMTSRTATQPMSELSALMEADEKLRQLGVTSGELSPAVREAMMSMLGVIDHLTEALRESRQRVTQLEAESTTDTLLPIANRRAFMQRLNWSLGMLKRYKTPATLLYFDLNDFKRINDTFGHAAGDVALRHVVAIVSQCKRSSDFIGRLGGDEFAVVMDFADQAAVEKCAARIAEKISAQPLLLGDLPVTLSVSYGVATLLPEDTLESVLDRADKAMYTHKRAYHAAKAKQSA